MGDSSVVSAVTSTQNPVTSYTKLRSNSVDSIRSTITLIESNKPIQMKEGSPSFPPSLRLEEPEVENTPGGIPQIIEHDEALSDSKKTLVEQYEQIHDALLLGIEVIEDATKKLYEAFKADKTLNTIHKEKEIKKESDTEFCLFKEISDFEETLFPQVEEAVHGLKTNLYSKEAFAVLDKIKAELDTRKAHLAKNLPPPQSKLFKLAHYLLDGLGTLITLILVAMTALGLVTLSTTVPCALAALICLIVKAWTEKTAIPENNKNMYLKSLEDQYKSTLNALKKMEDDVLVIEERQARQEMREAMLQEQREALKEAARETRAETRAIRAMQAEQQRQAEQERKATEQLLQKEHQSLLDAILNPAIEKASIKSLASAIISNDPNLLTEEEAKNMENWLNRRTHSPERVLSAAESSSSSQEPTFASAIIGQA